MFATRGPTGKLYTMALLLLHSLGMGKKSPPRSGKRVHDTPILGPRRRPTKVKPMSPPARRGGAYRTGVPTVRTGSPWLDEGTPEVNG